MAVSPLETLQAIEDIRLLVARRVRALDSKDWETYADCHAPDHVSHGAFSPGQGREAMMAGLSTAYAGISSIHLVHAPAIRLLSATEAEGSWGLEDRLFWLEGEQEHWAHGWGFYDETYRKTDGAWFITSRRLTYLRRELSPGSTRMSG